MSLTEIKDLFDKSRFPSGWHLTSTLLYTPVGLLLVLLRLLVALLLWLAASLLPDRNALRVFLSHGLSFTFGIIVKIHPEGECIDKRSRVIIANNVSVLDHFALRKATGALTPGVSKTPTALCNALGIVDMDIGSKEVVVANIKQFLATTTASVALQPEFSATNSRVGLLKFNSWPFSIEESVQPVAIEARRPDFVPIRLTSLASTWWSDVFWFMFVPYTIFTLKYLKIKRDSDYEDLAREVEKDLATTLGLQTTLYTVSDKVEFEKRCIMEKTYNRISNRRVTQSPQVVQNLEIQRMVRQVTEVFPMVPHNVVLRDILKTRNVDVTIANILDGIVTYTPERSPRERTTVTLHAKAQTSTAKDNTLHVSSFQERKAKMIKEAREKYIEKHGLTDC